MINIKIEEQNEELIIQMKAEQSSMMEVLTAASIDKFLTQWFTTQKFDDEAARMNKKNNKIH